MGDLKTLDRSGDGGGVEMAVGVAWNEERGGAGGRRSSNGWTFAGGANSSSRSIGVVEFAFRIMNSSAVIKSDVRINLWNWYPLT